VPRNNSHFTEEQWADFVNERLAREQLQTMQSHLDSNCKTCLKSAGVWQLVHTAAQRESQYEVPEWAIRYVQNAFTAAAKPQSVKRGFRIPRLVFDSLWQPAAVGVRSAAGAARQLRYKSGDIGVELQLEPEAGSARINVTGQVSKTAPEGENLNGIGVLATSIGGKLGEASTNRFGEFQMSFIPEKDLRFSFAMLDGESLFIPLDIRGTRDSYSE
jgi:hypothetical protein